MLIEAAPLFEPMLASRLLLCISRHRLVAEADQRQSIGVDAEHCENGLKAPNCVTRRLARAITALILCTGGDQDCKANATLHQELLRDGSDARDLMPRATVS